MEREREIGPAEVERLLSGRVDGSAEDLRSLAMFLEQVGDTGRYSPSAGLEERHLAAMADAFVPSTAPAPSLPRPKAFVKGSRAMLSTLFASMFAKVAAVSMSVLLAGGAFAATGNLGPIQDPVADAVDPLVDLPGGTDEDEADEVDDDADEAEDEADEVDDADDAADEAEDAADEDADDEGDEDESEAEGDEDESEEGESDDEGDESEDSGSDEVDEPEDGEGPEHEDTDENDESEGGHEGSDSDDGSESEDDSSDDSGASDEASGEETDD